MGVALQARQIPWIEGGLQPMQSQKHGNLSTMPAANQNSGRVQTMIEGKDPQEQLNSNPEE